MLVHPEGDEAPETGVEKPRMGSAAASERRKRPSNPRLANFTRQIAARSDLP